MPVCEAEIIEQLPGLRHPLRRLKTGFVVQEIDWRDDPDHDEAWADKVAAKHGGRQSRWWLQNYEKELVQGGEPVYPMLSRNIHIRTIPLTELVTSEWTLYRIIDHGRAGRHAECCAWCAVSRTRGDKYFYRQYFRTDATIAVNCKGILDVTEPREYIRLNVADTQVFNPDPTQLRTLADVYAENGLILTPADKRVEMGIEKVVMALVAAVAQYAWGRNQPEILRDVLNAPTLSVGDIERMAAEPAIWFHPSCAEGRYSLFEQLRNLRYLPQRGDPNLHGLTVKTTDIEDEGADVVRYAVQTECVAWAPSTRKPPTAGDILDRLLKASRQKDVAKNELM